MIRNNLLDCFTIRPTKISRKIPDSKSMNIPILSTKTLHRRSVQLTNPCMEIPNGEILIMSGKAGNPKSVFIDFETRNAGDIL